LGVGQGKCVHVLLLNVHVLAAPVSKLGGQFNSGRKVFKYQSVAAFNEQ
jgi:hypothetical protein